MHVFIRDRGWNVIICAYLGQSKIFKVEYNICLTLYLSPLCLSNNNSTSVPVGRMSLLHNKNSTRHAVQSSIISL